MLNAENESSFKDASGQPPEIVEKPPEVAKSLPENENLLPETKTSHFEAGTGRSTEAQNATIEQTREIPEGKILKRLKIPEGIVPAPIAEIDALFNAGYSRDDVIDTMKANHGGKTYASIVNERHKIGSKKGFRKTLRALPEKFRRLPEEMPEGIGAQIKPPAFSNKVASGRTKTPVF